MSPKKSAFNPSPPPASLTIAEIQNLGEFFKGLIENSTLKWWIIAAGIGALVEAAHVIWLFFVFTIKLLR